MRFIIESVHTPRLSKEHVLKGLEGPKNSGGWSYYESKTLSKLPGVTWDSELYAWTVELQSLEQLKALCNAIEEPVVLHFGRELDGTIEIIDGYYCVY
jgi:hypothetical protein